MALHVPKAPGMAQMMKDGARVRKQQNPQTKSHVVFRVGVKFTLFHSSTSPASKKQSTEI